jgi:propionate CoA-transferase
MNTVDKIAADPAALLATIEPGSTLVIGGAGGVGEPDLLIRELLRAFTATGSPHDLVEVHPFRVGERDGFGTSLLDPPGLIKRMIGSSFWPVGTPPLIRRILDNQMEAYNIPVGPLFGMLDAGASARPGMLTEIGLGTFVDPRNGGGALNDISRDQLVSVREIDGREYLYYRAIRPDVAFIRATIADEDGNLCTDEEATVIAPLLLAQAARSAGGQVFAQVREVVPRGSIDPRRVRVPGYLVDHLVVHPEQRQTPASRYDPTLVGAAPVDLTTVPVVEMSASKVVQRRALLEAAPGDVVAIGFGLPGNLPNVAVEEGVFDRITFTIEHGAIGGVNPYAFGSRTFPASHGPSAIVDSAEQVRAYAGGTVAMAYLGVGEIDSAGNVNVSRFGDRIPGCGGFVDLTQGIGKVVFCTLVGDRGHRKFVDQVQQVTMSASVALAKGQRIRYVTELGVFELAAEGLRLIEIAPDLTVDELRTRLGAKFTVAEPLAQMPARCWADGPMGLGADWAAR